MKKLKLSYFRLILPISVLFFLAACTPTALENYTPLDGSVIKATLECADVCILSSPEPFSVAYWLYLGDRLDLTGCRDEGEVKACTFVYPEPVTSSYLPLEPSKAVVDFSVKGVSYRLTYGVLE
jgi:hypothetical protein